MNLPKHAITSDTPKNMLLGAGTIVKNLVYDYQLTNDTSIVSGKTYYTRSGSAGSYTYTEVASPSVEAIATYYELGWSYDLLGASNGGNKYNYEREYLDLEADGKSVSVEDFDRKVAETFKITFNLAEYKETTIVTALSLAADTSGTVPTGFTKYKPSKTNSYVDNLGFIGQTADGRDIIIICPKAFCKSAFEVSTQNKAQGSAFALEFDGVAPSTATSFDELGIEFYFPTATV